MARVLITVPDDLLIDLDEAVYQDRSNRSEYIRDAIKAKMKVDGFQYGKRRTQEERAQYAVQPGKKRTNTPNAVRERLNLHSPDEVIETPKKAKTAKATKNPKAKQAKKPVTATQKKQPVKANATKTTKASPKTKKALMTSKA